MIIRVFLAEHHTLVRDGVQLLVNSEPDMQVVGATGDGRSAVRMAHKLRPDVAVMGITMPELNGIDATEQIRHGNLSTRVVILSMLSDIIHMQRALRAGASGYVSKDSGGEELISAIRTVHMGGGRHLNASMAERIVEDYLLLNGSGEADGPLALLSPRETEVFQHIVKGKTMSEIGVALGLSPKTIHTYRERVMEKLSVSDIPELVGFGIHLGLLPAE